MPTLLTTITRATNKRRAPAHLRFVRVCTSMAVLCLLLGIVLYHTTDCAAWPCIASFGGLAWSAAGILGLLYPAVIRRLRR